VTVKLYMDVHVRWAITDGLRRRDVDVLTAQEDGGATLADPLLLDRATSLVRVLFSQDEDLLREATLPNETTFLSPASSTLTNYGSQSDKPSTTWN